MNVNEMTTQEKTIKLATLCQWQISEVDEQWRVWVKAPDCKHSTTDLYQEWAMFLAWRVLNWGASRFDMLDWWDTFDMPTESPEVAQMAWLDKILELAIEAGMIE